MNSSRTFSKLDMSDKIKYVICYIEFRELVTSSGITRHEIVNVKNP